MMEVEVHRRKNQTVTLMTVTSSWVPPHADGRVLAGSQMEVLFHLRGISHYK